ncbi:Bug family tripartite tricarboxylate transporter substrate binding protein [Sabulicella glaciei]|uniref:Tripartite tricarboxylate transporter substrate binding protein n=1 Tax=Sabulicella glaciei TaxID=2984948 RepID=A0ABT3NPZ0_9PROT|nr:tripartite tricarboxylate transporter substrate binding protein [Roseococcus sp. MDT2-1-1]MCW8084229.1 tripartite tricarboxylate transporter substrate binding protein [Roseococcus sp. MDT2-1-1]
MKRRHILLATGGATLLAAPSLHAQGARWPDREITILVPFGAGGSTDVSVRAVAAEAEKTLGVPIQIVNRVGGQGTASLIQLAQARPDGHTLGSAAMSGLAIAPHMLDVPYNLDSFAYLSGAARFLYGIGVKADGPYSTIQDLFNAAKARRITFSATGPPNNLGMFELNRKYGTRFHFIPFQSGAEAVTAVLGGHVEATSQTPPEMIPAIQSGRMKLLAASSPARWKEFPDVATLRESGFDVTIESLLGFIAPRATPADRLATLSDAFRRAAEAPALEAALERFGMVPAVMDGQTFERAIREGHARFGEQLREAGLARR